MKAKKPHWADATPYEIALKKIEQLNVDYAELEIECAGLKVIIEDMYDKFVLVIGQREELK